MSHVATLIALFPLAGFVAILVLGSSLTKNTAGWIGTSAVGASFIASVATFV